MEQKIFSKFNFYDQLGYLMVGSIATIIFILDVRYFFNKLIPVFNLDTFLVWFVIIYFIGHFIQGLANLFNKIPLINFLIKEDKVNFSESEEEILNEAKKYFKIRKQNNNKIWNFCYTLTLAKDITGNIQSFNAYYSLYRGWLVIFLLQSFFLLYFSIFNYSRINLSLLVISILLSLVFYLRSKRFWQHLRNKVFETFVVVKTLNL